MEAKKKEPWLAKAVMSKKEQFWRYHCNWLQTIWHSHKINTTWYWHNRHKDQWNRTEEWDINLHSYAHLIFDKVDQSIHWRKESPLKNDAGETGNPHIENWN
jgi:hypothetical protein